MVCITVIHFISLFLLDMEIHLFLILSIILYISDWPLLKKFAKGRSVVSFPKRHLQTCIFVVYECHYEGYEGK